MTIAVPAEFRASALIRAGHQCFLTLKSCVLAVKILRPLFIRKVLWHAEIAEEDVCGVCYHENEFSEMDISFLGLVGKMKELV